jgi:hypothetical protein
MLTRQTFLGYARMDIITGPVKLQFGRYNYCPLNEKEGDKLYDSMIEHGVQRFKVDNTIPIIVLESYIKVKDLTDDEHANEDLPEIQWTDEAKKAGYVIAPGGRHRHFVASKLRLRMSVQYNKAVASFEKMLDRYEKDHPQVKAAQQKLDNVEREMEESSLWMVKIYNKGEDNLIYYSYTHIGCCSCGRNKQRRNRQLLGEESGNPHLQGDGGGMDGVQVQDFDKSEARQPGSLQRGAEDASGESHQNQ